MSGASAYKKDFENVYILYNVHVYHIYIQISSINIMIGYDILSPFYSAII